MKHIFKITTLVLIYLSLQSPVLQENTKVRLKNLLPPPKKVLELKDVEELKVLPN